MRACRWPLFKPSDVWGKVLGQSEVVTILEGHIIQGDHDTWVRFPRTGILAKIRPFFLLTKVEPLCDQTVEDRHDFSIDLGQLCPVDSRNTFV